MHICGHWALTASKMQLWSVVREPQKHFGRTNSPENAFNGHKCHLVPVSRFSSLEPLDAIGGTLVEKHCCRWIDHLPVVCDVRLSSQKLGKYFLMPKSNTAKNSTHDHLIQCPSRYATKRPSLIKIVLTSLIETQSASVNLSICC